MKKIAILMPNWIGDLIMALSVVARKDTAENSITLIVPERFMKLAQILCNYSLISYRRRSRKELNESIENVKKAGFDELYLLPRSFSAGWFALRTGIKKRVGIKGECRNVLLSNGIKSDPYPRKKHLTQEYSRVLNVPYKEPQKWQGFKIDPDQSLKGSVVICPGATFGPAKQWTGFSELIKLLPHEEFVILGDNSDALVAQQIAPQLPHRVKNLAGQTTLQEAASIIAGASMVISNDSGLMHLAGYIGVPVIGIYCSTTPVWTCALGQHSKILHSNVVCSPCFKRECPFKHYNCIRAITPEKVLELILAMKKN